MKETSRRRTAAGRRRRARRRGAALLVVLSLLMLFVLVAVTYAVVAGYFRRAATASAMQDRAGDPPEKLLERAMYQLVRDTSLPSSLQGHSLLHDLYGTDGVQGVVADDPQLEAGGQILLIPFVEDAQQPFGRHFSRLDDAYNGAVFTVLSGPAAGHSTRVTDYVLEPPQSGQPRRGLLRVEAFDSDHNGNVRVGAARLVLPRRGDVFLVNGRPFNGAGFGYDPGSFNIDLTVAVGGAPLPVALLPHFAGYPPDPTGPSAVSAASVGGADESWDAVDFQNLFLAMVPPSPDSPIVPSFHRPALIHYWFNWVAQTWLAPAGVTDPAEQRAVFMAPYGGDNVRGTADESSPPWSQVPLAQRDAIADIKRRVIFRPLAEDHADFDGSNPAFFRSFAGNPTDLVRDLSEQYRALVNLDGQNRWDVDNDRDGRPDSVWIDAGLPLQPAPNGRLVKPLVAILCEDLDGRVDLNAHGSLEQHPDNNLSTTWHPGPDGQWGLSGDPADRGEPGSDDYYVVKPATGTYAGSAVGTDGTVTLPRGLGVGPAEVSLGPVFQGAMQDWRRILLGTSRTAGRYGSDGLPGLINRADDLFSRVKNFGLPNVYYDPNSGPRGSTLPSGYSSPPDTRGLGAIGLDHSGQPLARDMGLPGEPIDDPYEMLLQVLAHQALGSVEGGDAPFTLAELERLLRWNDMDAASLPDRLLRLAAASFHGADQARVERRALVTTHSAHLPVPNLRAPRKLLQQFAAYAAAAEADSQIPLATRQWIGELNAALIASPSIVDLYAARLLLGAAPNLRTTPTPTLLRLVNGELKKLMPWELLHGQLFDINRPIGNGVDDTPPGQPGRGVVDEPRESLAGELVWPPAGTPQGYYPVPFNYVNNGPIPSDPRATYARHLYCLLMLLIDQDFIVPAADENPALSDDDRRELTARRAAQWAVNVIDFRDPDSIMTPFEYDVNPFNGWRVDGWVGRNPVTGADDFDVRNPPNAGLNPERRLVWGMEQPDLLITETVAFHDRRVQDSEFDDGSDPNNPTPGKRNSDPSQGDTTLDQYRVPQGSLFVELYCPRAQEADPTRRADPRLPRELYRRDADGKWRLDLARLAPGDPQIDGGRRHPVWRIVISEQTYNNPDKAESSAAQLAGPTEDNGRPDSASFEPDDLSLLGPDPSDANRRGLYNRTLPPNSPERLQIDRIVWFAPQNPTGYRFANRIFFNYLYSADPHWDPALEPGRYLVVGPRSDTYVGNRTDGWSNRSLAQRILLRPVAFDTTNPNARIQTATGAVHRRASPDNNNPGPITTPQPGQQILSAVGIVAAALPPAGWTDTNRTARQGIGLNISEPLPNDPTTPYYREPNGWRASDPNIPPDAYIDESTNQLLLPDLPFDSDPDADRPLLHYAMLGTGTYPDVRSLFLQRLADPTLPWNPLPTDPNYGDLYSPDRPVNPYITVDWATVDLTVYNGEDRKPSSWGDEWDPDEMNFPAPEEVTFVTRERGNKTPLLWMAYTEFPSSRRQPPDAPPENYFPYTLVNTLGWLNSTFGPPLAAPTPPPSPTADPPPGVGDPQTPFPWLTWNNRPFANPGELLLVPASAPSRLTHEYRVAFAPYGFEPYDNAPPNKPYDPTGTDDEKWANFRSPYPHLLNFFHATHTDLSSGNAEPGANVYRLFDLVETPSPFVGAETWYNPGPDPHFGGAPAGSAADSFRPPYNRLSRFRDAGRVNINTIFDSRVWEALTKNFPEMDPVARGPAFMTNVMGSRRGYPGANLFSLDPRYPTLFGNPFRSGLSGGLMPLLVDPSAGTPLQPNLRTDDVQGSLLRQDLVAPRDHPLLTVPLSNAYPELLRPHRDQKRNPFFRYHGLARLTNLVTTHSNVFAVWITIGYFEVEPLRPNELAAANPAHREGYRLGREFGSDTGEVVRHRAFFIIDRSVPVAFQPGENYNVDRCILVRRFIE